MARRLAWLNFRRRRVWLYLGVVAFVLVDTVLICMALNSTRLKAHSDDAGTVPAAAAVGAPRHPEIATSASPTPTPTATAPASALVVLVPPTRILAALDDETAWRAMTGPCPGTPAAPERTTDSGATWTTTDASGPTGVTALQRISVTNTRVAAMVGLAGSDCTPQLVRTFVAGDNYSSQPGGVDDVWYLNPADPSTVHGPQGTRAAPCASALVLAPRDKDSAAVLCAEGQLFQTTDAATGWSAPVLLHGVVNLAATGSGYVAAAVVPTECAGVQVLTLSLALETTTVGCFPIDVPAASLVGRIALVEAGGTVWLWAADALVRSTDSGTGWK